MVMTEQIGSGTRLKSGDMNFTFPTLQLTNIEKTGTVRNTIDLTHDEITDGYKKFRPESFVDPGTINVTVVMDVQQQEEVYALINDVEPKPFVIEFPNLGVGTDNPLTYEFDAYLVEFGETAPFDEKIEQTMALKLTSAITVTNPADATP